MRSNETLIDSLFLAIHKGNLSVVSSLIKNFPGLLIEKKDGRTPFHYASHEKSWNSVEALSESAPELPDDEARIGFAVSHAMRNQRFDLAISLLKKHRNLAPNVVFGTDQNSTLHLAANNKKTPTELVKLLLIRGANPNYLNKNGQTPLYIAIDNKNEPITNCLLNSDEFYFSGFREFLTIYILKINPTGLLLREMIREIMIHCGGDTNTLRQEVTKAEKNIIKINKSILNNQIIPGIPREYYFFAKKTFSPLFIEKITNLALKCQNDEEKSVYVHRLLNEFGFTNEECAKAALSILKDMKMLYSKNGSTVTNFFHFETTLCKERDKLCSRLTDYLKKKEDPSLAITEKSVDKGWLLVDDDDDWAVLGNLEDFPPSDAQGQANTP